MVHQRGEKHPRGIRCARASIDGSVNIEKHSHITLDEEYVYREKNSLQRSVIDDSHAHYTLGASSVNSKPPQWLQVSPGRADQPP